MGIKDFIKEQWTRLSHSGRTGDINSNNMPYNSNDYNNTNLMKEEQEYIEYNIDTNNNNYVDSNIDSNNEGSWDSNGAYVSNIAVMIWEHAAAQLTSYYRVTTVHTEYGQTVYKHNHRCW